MAWPTVMAFCAECVSGVYVDFAKQGCQKHESFSSLGDAVARDIDHTERSFVSGFV